MLVGIIKNAYVRLLLWLLFSYGKRTTWGPYLEREMKAANWDLQNDDIGLWMYKHLMAMCAVFSMEGHSGSSASWAVSLFSKVAMFKPLSPLTGEDWEWQKIGPDVWQNLRCSSIFKGKDGKAYNIDGRVFREPSGACWTRGLESRVYITFPYEPVTEYVDVDSADD